MSKKNVSFSEKVEIKIIDNNETIRWKIFTNILYEYLPYILSFIIGIVILYYLYKNRSTLFAAYPLLYTKFADKAMTKL